MASCSEARGRSTSTSTRAVSSLGLNTAMRSKVSLSARPSAKYQLVAALGAPGVTSRVTVPSMPVSVWIRSTTNRPLRALMVLEMRWRTGTTSVRSTVTSRRGGTKKPCRASGERNPSSVSKVMSTTASAAKGLNKAKRSDDASCGVVWPHGKYHWSDACELHRSLSQPPIPATSWLTTTPPWSSSTNAAAHSPWARVESTMRRWSRAGTSTGNR